MARTTSTISKRSTGPSSTDIYPWAGEVRTVRIAKSSLFALPEHIEAYLRDQLSRLAGENHLRNLQQDLFVERLTTTSPRATPCIRSARAMAEHREHSSVSLLVTPATRSAGTGSPPPATSRRPPPVPTRTTPHLTGSARNPS